MISACFDNSFNNLAFAFGVMQALTCWFTVGWIWSIYQGFCIWQKSSGRIAKI
jgi:hypothetical protein